MTDFYSSSYLVFWWLHSLGLLSLLHVAFSANAVSLFHFVLDLLCIRHVSMKNFVYFFYLVVDTCNQHFVFYHLQLYFHGSIVWGCSVNDASLSYINFYKRSCILSIYIAPFVAIFLNMYWENSFITEYWKLGEMVPNGVNIHEHNMCLDVLLLCNKASEIVWFWNK